MTNLHRYCTSESSSSWLETLANIAPRYNICFNDKNISLLHTDYYSFSVPFAGNEERLATSETCDTLSSQIDTFRLFSDKVWCRS